MCGVYPNADVGTIGDQVSSTYEGRHVTLLASELSHSDALSVVTKGYPVWFGDIVGVAFKTEVAGTDLIPVDTEGIWIQDVHAADIDGDSAVVPGDRLFINTTTGLISKTSYPASNLPFGYALGSVDAGNTDTIAVKVHQDPSGDPTGLTVIGGVTYFASINVAGAALMSGGASVAGTTDLQTVIVHSSLGVAAGGILTFSDTVMATLLPAADPSVAGQLWSNAGVITRSAG